jgi:hypothetical protein
MPVARDAKARGARAVRDGALTVAPRERYCVGDPGDQPAATGTGFSIGMPTMLPHSVQLPS